MAHDEEGPRPAVEDVLELGQGLDVEVVRRLVEHEDVGLGHEQPEDLQAAPLAAGEVSDARLLPAAGEAELLRELRGRDLLLAEHRHLLDVLHGIDDATVGERVELSDVLREVPDDDGDALLALAGDERDLAGEHAEQRRLARAVDADDADAVPRGELPGHPVQEGAAPEVDGRVVEVDDVLAEPGRREAHELDVVAKGWFVGDECVGGVDPELRLARPGGWPAAQPGELLAQQVVAPFGGHGGDPVALRLRQDVGGVPAVVLLDLAIDDLPGAVGHGVEEPPVVGDGGERVVGPGAMTDKVVGEPRHAFDVEVVRRLVEEQHVGVVDEDLRQRQPAALPAGHGADDGIPPAQRLGGETAEQPVDDVTHPGVARPLVLGPVAENHLTDRRRGVEDVRLAQHADGGRTAAGDPSVVEREVPVEHLHERRLAAAVAPDDADAGPRVDPEGDTVEDVRRAERQGGPLDRDEVGHQVSRGVGMT